MLWPVGSFPIFLDVAGHLLVETVVHGLCRSAAAKLYRKSQRKLCSHRLLRFSNQLRTLTSLLTILNETGLLRATWFAPCSGPSDWNKLQTQMGLNTFWSKTSVRFSHTSSSNCWKLTLSLTKKHTKKFKNSTRIQQLKDQHKIHQVTIDRWRALSVLYILSKVSLIFIKMWQLL